MAYRDYIHCKKCDCKLIYDGNDSIRESLENAYGDPEKDTFTIKLLCPECLRELEAELARLRGRILDWADVLDGMELKSFAEAVRREAAKGDGK